MKLNRDFMDRVVRPAIPPLVQSIEMAKKLKRPIGMKEAIIEAAVLEFLASYEDKRADLAKEALGESEGIRS